jgi:hypothetical protein
MARSEKDGAKPERRRAGRDVRSARYRSCEKRRARRVDKERARRSEQMAQEEASKKGARGSEDEACRWRKRKRAGACKKGGADRARGKQTRADRARGSEKRCEERAQFWRRPSPGKGRLERDLLFLLFSCLLRVWLGFGFGVFRRCRQGAVRRVRVGFGGPLRGKLPGKSTVGGEKSENGSRAVRFPLGPVFFQALSVF